MKLIIVGSALLTFAAHVAAAATRDLRTERTVHASQIVGSDNGDPWNDWEQVTSGNHKRIASVRMVGCGTNDHIIGMEVGFRDNHAANPVINYVYHGGHGKSAEQRLDMKTDEFIVSVTTTTWKKQVKPQYPWKAAVFHERLSSIELTTNKHQTVRCGVLADNRVTVHGYAPDRALLHFEGRAGAAIDQLIAHWQPEADF